MLVLRHTRTERTRRCFQFPFVIHVMAEYEDNPGHSSMHEVLHVQYHHHLELHQYIPHRTYRY
jgi:hypothetical protein